MLLSPLLSRRLKITAITNLSAHSAQLVRVHAKWVDWNYSTGKGGPNSLHYWSLKIFWKLLARDAFGWKESSRYCHDVRPSACPTVCLSGSGVHSDHAVHISADLSLWLDSPMFWAPWHQSMSTYSQPSFSSSIWKSGGYGQMQTTLCPEKSNPLNNVR